MGIDYGCIDSSKIIASVNEISEEINKELGKETPNRNRLTQLRMEQMLRGIFLTQCNDF